MSDLVLIKSFSGRMEAEQLKEHLESKGIVSLVSATDLGGVIGPTATGASLMVERGAAQKAMEVLRSLNVEVEGKQNMVGGQVGGFLTKLRKWLKGS